MTARLFKLGDLRREPLAAEKRADNVRLGTRLGTSRCQRCGRAMCYGSAASSSLGPVCGARMVGNRQRLLLFPSEDQS